jgi:hypothetical protein
MDWRCGLSGRAPAFQVQSPKFKPQYPPHKKSVAMIFSGWAGIKPRTLRKLGRYTSLSPFALYILQLGSGLFPLASLDHDPTIHASCVSTPHSVFIG